MIYKSFLIIKLYCQIFTDTGYGTNQIYPLKSYIGKYCNLTGPESDYPVAGYALLVLILIMTQTDNIGELPDLGGEGEQAADAAAGRPLHRASGQGFHIYKQRSCSCNCLRS